MADNSPLQKIYEEYFDLIDEYFGGIKRYLDYSEDFPHIKMANQIASYDMVADLIVDATDDLGVAIQSFWSKHHAEVSKYLKESNHLKCVYSGDLSPLDLERFLKRSVLYIDTVILPDPILNISSYTKPVIFDKRHYLKSLIRHVFNVWRIKDLVLTQVEPRPLIIYPLSFFSLNEKERNEVLTQAQDDFFTYHSQLFGQTFDSPDKFNAFLDEHPTAEDLYGRVKGPELLPLKFRTLEAFVQEFRTEYGDIQKKVIAAARTKNEAHSFATYSDYQMKRAREQLFFCNHFSAEPVADYEVAWSFNNYVIGGSGVDSAVLNALHKSEFDWIGNIPLAELGRLREQGELGYIRDVLRQGLRDIHTKADRDLDQTMKQVQANLSEAFKRQEEDEQKLQKEVKNIYKKDIPIALGVNLVGLIPGPGAVVGFLSSTYDIGKKYLSTREELAEVKKSPINLLLDAYEKGQKK